VEIKVDAIVIRTADYGESDRMLTLFTLQRGKLSAAAKGVRKAGAKLRFAAQPFCFAEYVLAQRGERNTVISAAETDSFYALRGDIGKFYAAASLAGVCDALLYDGMVSEELFLRAVNALRGMCDTLREKAVKPVLAVLVGSEGEKITMAVSVNKLAQEKGLKAGNIVKELAAIAGGKGGGKPDFAMAGLKDPNKIDEALHAAAEVAAKQMN